MPQNQPSLPLVTSNKEITCFRIENDPPILSSPFPTWHHKGSTRNKTKKTYPLHAEELSGKYPDETLHALNTTRIRAGIAFAKEGPQMIVSRDSWNVVLDIKAKNFGILITNLNTELGKLRDEIANLELDYIGPIKQSANITSHHP